MKYFLLPILIYMSACGQFHSVKDPRTIHGVNPAFQPYIETYLSYKGRGLDYDIPIQFSDLPMNWNGLCTKFETGERQIEIDKEWWDNYSNEYNRITVIAHELGHCDLNRPHRLDTFPTGQPMSIMYPYTILILPEDLDYYMNELFNY